jgi:alanine racemase
MPLPLSGSAGLSLPLDEATRELNSWLELDLDAVSHNVHALRQWIGGGVELIAVVKANAYGHGTAGIAPALEAAGVDRFAVVWPAEAVALRDSGISRPILVLGHAFPGDAQGCIARDITLTAHSLPLLEAVSNAAKGQGKTARVHIKVDTGLHRSGVTPDEAVALAEAARTLPAIEVEGLSTHMANADEVDDSFTDVQHERFRAVASRLPWVRFRHTANSASAIRRQELRYEGVRLGLSLHGIFPPNSPGPDLRPVLSLKARLARVSDVPVGDGVSYGLAWRAERPSRVGLVPVGYADGWRRSLGGAGAVLVAGQSCPILGRVAMDQFIVDVTAVEGCAEGAEAVLIGSQGAERITADEVAALAGTISWDVVASLQARLPRLYHRNRVVERVI